MLKCGVFNERCFGAFSSSNPLVNSLFYYLSKGTEWLMVLWSTNQLLGVKCGYLLGCPVSFYDLGLRKSCDIRPANFADLFS
jgi:hypothetical protein